MKKLTLIFCFICIVFSGISQNSSSDSLKSVFAANITQQSELVNVFYDALNDKFVIENNTKQPHNFNFGIYNITGTLIKEIQCEIQNGKNFDETSSWL